MKIIAIEYDTYYFLFADQDNFTDTILEYLSEIAIFLKNKTIYTFFGGFVCILSSRMTNDTAQLEIADESTKMNFPTKIRR